MAGSSLNVSSSSPRWEIPDLWADHGRCPACDTAPLKAVHLPDLPDYLICDCCELSFEVEQGGKRIRLKNIPERLERYESRLKHHWIEPSILGVLLEEPASLPQYVLVDRKPEMLSDEEVFSRALSFHRLGNKPKMIEFLLVQAGSTQEQATAALDKVKTWIAQESRGQNRKFYLLAGIGLFLLTVMFGGWYYANRSIISQLQNGVANPSRNQPNEVLQFIDALPDWAKPGFLNSADTRVQSGGIGVSACPQSTGAAAKLFGGIAAMWQYDAKTGSWRMMDAGTPTTIRIPAGMYAGYISNQSLQFSSVAGPATILNVNFVAIMCE